MLGKKPDEQIREPFLWDIQANDKGRAKWIEAKYSTDATVTPLAIQKSMSTSYFNHYKEVIKFRNSNRALALGSLELFEEENLPSQLMVYFRRHDDQDVLVAHNLCEEVLSFKTPENYVHQILSLGGASLVQGTISLPAYSSIIIEH
jgi:glycosidase